MEARVVVASERLSSRFTGLMYSHVRGHVRPGQQVIESEVVLAGDREYVRYHLMRLLEEKPRPTALIGICMQPGADVVADFRGAGCPVILLDAEEEGATTITSDNFAGGYTAGKHLAETGRRACAIVVGETKYNPAALRRLEGFAKALAERGLRFSERNIVEVRTYSRREGFDALATIVKACPDVDAVFCAAGDLCAAGVLAAARELRLAVPDRLAVLGYDDHPLARLSNPPLSSILQPLAEMAGESWRLATEAAAEALEKPRKLAFDPVLVRRVTA